MIKLKFGLWYIDYLAAWSYHPMFPFEIWEMELRQQIPKYQNLDTLQLVDIYHVYTVPNQWNYNLINNINDILTCLLGSSTKSVIKRFIDLSWLLLRQRINLEEFKEAL